MNKSSNTPDANRHSRREFLLGVASVPMVMCPSPAINRRTEFVGPVREGSATCVQLRRAAIARLSELQLVDPTISTPHSWSRLEKELALIEKLGLASDFQKAHEIVHETNSSGLRAFGRETEHSSLVAYGLGIVHVNPSAVGLTYEDFAHELSQKRRVSLDVCWNHWERLVEGKPGLETIRLIPSDDLTAISDIQTRVRQSARAVSISTCLAPLDDKQTFEMLSRGDTEGIRFLDQPQSQRALSRLRPDCFQDLVGFAALEYGWFDTSALGRLISTKHTQSKYDWPSEVAECLAHTYDQVLYHEQAFHIIQELLFCDYATAVQCWSELIDPPLENHAEVRRTLQESARRIGLDKLQAADLIKQLAGAAPESRSLKFSVNGAFLDFTLAYLKAHYPTQFGPALNS